MRFALNSSNLPFLLSFSICLLDFSALVKAPAEEKVLELLLLALVTRAA
jgi:hypothetical protein